jgi:hypothetical protein
MLECTVNESLNCTMVQLSSLCSWFIQQMHIYPNNTEIIISIFYFAHLIFQVWKQCSFKLQYAVLKNLTLNYIFILHYLHFHINLNISITTEFIHCPF